MPRTEPRMVSEQNGTDIASDSRMIHIGRLEQLHSVCGQHILEEAVLDPELHFTKTMRKIVA